MNQLMSESVQASVRPHECEDTYYADKKNQKIQCFPAIVENRFVVGIPSLTSGSSSTITFNPDGLISDIVLTAVLPVPAVPVGGALAGEGLGLTRGWLYQMIDRISVRYAGSSLYFFNGEQELMSILSECEDSVKRDNMLTLGGAELTSPADWAQSSLRSASIYIKLPHNSPSAQEKPLGFPTDAIAAPVQIQIFFKQFSSVVLAQATTGATLAAVQATIPAGFSSGEVQFKQAHLQDRGDAIASRQDLSKHALSIPLKNFSQTQFSTTLTAGSGNVNLTGFRSGSVQGIMVWAVAVSDLTSVGAKQPLRYLPIKDVELSVNGLVYYRANNNSSQLWDLCERKTAAQYSTTSLTWNVGTQVYDPVALSGYWVWIPFAQGVETLRDEMMLSNGLGISNSVVNLSVNTASGVDCVLYAQYLYNATILASGGSCDYVF
jgi:hypothetical protein